MYYVAANGEVYDDSYGMETAPAYGIDPQGHRFELPPESATQLTERFISAKRGRLPFGDAIARLTKAVGIKPCAPCQQRQAALNQLGDRVAGYWWAK